MRLPPLDVVRTAEVLLRVLGDERDRIAGNLLVVAPGRTRVHSLGEPFGAST
jgi:hypothetical protein